MCITYHVVATGDRATASYSTYKTFGENLDVWFMRYASGQTDKQTDRQTYKHADRNASQLYLGSNLIKTI